MQFSKLDLSKIDFKKNRILVDWFSFSSRIDCVDSLICLLGMTDCKWEFTYGCKGYSERYYFNGISIHYKGSPIGRFGKPIEGVWLEMSGEGCRTFESYGNGDWNNLFDYCNRNELNITMNRIDLAYDDFIGLLDMSSIVDDTYKLNFVSKFRSNPEILCSVDTVTGYKAYTVTHGRMKSDTFIRIYDKRYEQSAFDFCDHWVRNEIMLRHDRAMAAVSLIADGKPVDEMYFMIMNNYLRYIQPQRSDSNRWRIPQADHWKRFSESVTTYRISLWSTPGTDYTSTNLKNYVENMSGSAIYTYIALYGVDKLVEVCQTKQSNLAPKYKLILSGEADEQSIERLNTLFDSVVPKPVPKVPQKQYSCVYCGNKDISDNFVSYSNINNSGMCRSCYYSMSGVDI